MSLFEKRARRMATASCLVLLGAGLIGAGAAPALAGPSSRGPVDYEFIASVALGNQADQVMDCPR